MKTKLAETGAWDPPPRDNKFRFSDVTFHNCDPSGLQSAYTGSLPYVKNGLLFYNNQAHYQAGNTPLVLIWKDDNCSEYFIDTDNKGEVPDKPHVADVKKNIETVQGADVYAKLMLIHQGKVLKDETTIEEIIICSKSYNTTILISLAQTSIRRFW